MTKKQEKHLNEVIYSLHVEGFETTEEERQTLVDILEGRRTSKDVLEQYISEAKSYAGV